MATMFLKTAAGVRWTLAVISFALIAVRIAAAQSAPDTETGRYSLSQVADGYLRLDTRTGAVSTCINKGGWICRTVPDERAALDTEIGRLQNENKKLRDQLAQRGGASAKTDAPIAKGDSEKKAEQGNADGKAIELQLPAEHAKVMALLDRMWQRLVELAGLVQKKLSEKI